MSDFSERLFTLKKVMKIKKDELAALLGVSRTMLYNYEQDDPTPPGELLATLARMEKAHGIERAFTLPALAGIGAALTRLIPVIGMAHAGERVNYDEVPCDADDYIATDCTDPLAFGVWITGDSMWPDIYDRDIATLSPSKPLYSNAIAVLRLVDDGVLVRKVEVRGDKIRLIPSNTPKYEPETITRDQIKWAYPVHDTKRLFMR